MGRLNPKIYVQELIIEVTRRCNLDCDHCLRGHAQDMDMPEGRIADILAAMDGISHVTFTGGEPSLNLSFIDRFMHEADAAGKLPSSFFVATNGMVNQLELAKILLRWYPFMWDKESTAVSLSIDQFHMNDDRGPDYVKALAFYQPYKEHDESKSTQDWVIDRGKAFENGIGTVYHMIHEMDTEYDEDDNVICVDTLYVAANGKITYDCDMDYDSIDDSVQDITDLRDICEEAACDAIEQSKEETE